MDGLVEQRIRLVVDGVHGVVHDVVERQERRAAQLLGQVLVGVRLQRVRHRPRLHRAQLRVELVERRAAAMVGAELCRAARALEEPVLGLSLPQRLERGDVRTMAQILERRVAVVRVSAVCEVVEGGPVGLVAALAHGCAKCVSVVTE